jgi:5-methylcytosine-specific restriction endonuclease McrA
MKYPEEYKGALELEKSGDLVEAYYIFVSIAEENLYANWYKNCQNHIKRLKKRIIKADFAQCKDRISELGQYCLQEVLSRPKLAFVNTSILEYAVAERMYFKHVRDYEGPEEFRMENKDKYIWDIVQQLKKNASLSKKIQEKATHVESLILSLPPPREVTATIREKVIRRERWHCFYCGRSGWYQNKETDIHVDHIFPYSEGGTCELENLIAACVDCNFEKSNQVLNGLEGPIKNYDALIAYCKSVKSEATFEKAGIRAGRPSFDKLFAVGFKCQNSDCSREARNGAKLYWCWQGEAKKSLVLCEKCSAGTKRLDSF